MSMLIGLETSGDFHMAYINAMEDKDDYMAYKRHCLDNGYQPLPLNIYHYAINPPDIIYEDPKEPEIDIPEQSRGLGDTVAKVTRATGLVKLAELYTKVTGKPCGCHSRQNALNKLLPYNIKEEEN